MSVYFMISLNTQTFLSLETSNNQDYELEAPTIDFTLHPH